MKQETPDKHEEARRLWQAARMAHNLHVQFQECEHSPMAEMLAQSMKDVRDCAMSEAQRVNAFHRPR
jgi:hypothetical protein